MIGKVIFSKTSVMTLKDLTSSMSIEIRKLRRRKEKERRDTP
jgi:hypothetical protein